MKTLNELRAFCEGYRFAAPYAPYLPGIDDWIVWGGYDIKFAGAEYSSYATDTNLRVDAYKAGWTGSIGDPIHSFTV